MEKLSKSQSNLIRSFFAAALAAAGFFGTAVNAQELPSREQLNSGTVRIITGTHDYLISRMASDLSAVLDEGDNLRVLAVSGRGGISDLADVLLLRGIDVAVVPADVIDHVDKRNMLPTMKQNLRVVSRLFNRVAHVVAGTGIKSISDLQGKKINVVSRYHGEFVTAQNLFAAMGLKYEPVYLDQRLALQRVRSGEIAATLIMSGRPNPLLEEIRVAGNLKIIGIPFSQNMPAVYFPAELTSADYPDLILPGETIRTIGTASIMLAFNFGQGSPRRIKITRFVDAFLSRLADLQNSPRHPRWRDVKLTVAVPGIDRYGPVVAWLQTNKPPEVIALQQPKKGKRSVEELFKAFIASESASGGAAKLLRLEKPELFARFKAWRKQQEGAPAIAATAAAPQQKQSLRYLFRQFIDEEAGRIGKDKVLALSKTELFQRFLDWRKRSNTQ